MADLKGSMTRFRPPILSVEEADRLTIFRSMPEDWFGVRHVALYTLCPDIYAHAQRMLAPSALFLPTKTQVQRTAESTASQMVLSLQTASMPRCQLRRDMKRSDGHTLDPKACLDCVER